MNMDYHHIYDFSDLPLPRYATILKIGRRTWSTPLENGKRLGAEETATLLLGVMDIIRDAGGLVCECGYDENFIFLNYVEPIKDGYVGRMGCDIDRLRNKYNVMGIGASRYEPAQQQKLRQRPEAWKEFDERPDKGSRELPAPTFHVSKDTGYEKCWAAETPVGWFRYGYDIYGTAYWIGGRGKIRKVTDLEEARSKAVESYRDAVWNHPVARILVASRTGRRED
jgi:hypothetical protein